MTSEVCTHSVDESGQEHTQAWAHTHIHVAGMNIVCCDSSKDIIHSPGDLTKDSLPINLIPLTDCYAHLVCIHSADGAGQEDLCLDSYLSILLVLISISSKHWCHNI